MKLFVLHDKNGTIKGFAIPGDAVKGKIHPVPQETVQATEIDIRELADDDDDAKTQSRLLELISTHQVRLGDGEPSLVPKTED